ncbi:hypothetical protein ACFQZE_01240 [Paenibacillus sp. GCM10027627]|uniref:hypothetical protein n=1 Tax=unclassified Paenibacillus TaxID=185978 RepID=UPI0036298E83
MFHPTVFDNLKVAFENNLYDLDNLDGIIEITGRRDILDMAVMSRELALGFRLAGDSRVKAELVLSATLNELAAEILEQEEGTHGSKLALRFILTVLNEDECAGIERCIEDIWHPEQKPVQTLSRTFGSGEGGYSNTIELGFHRRIGEEQIEDIPDLLDHAVRTLTALKGL